MKKGLIVSTVLASLVFGVTAAQAGAMTKKELVNKEVAVQNKNFKVASANIQKGLNDTLKAITALQKNDVKMAKKDLEDATKYFNKALKLDPRLGLVPIANEITVFQYKGTPKDIKEAVKIAEGMLKKNSLQFARDILAPLKDEIDIATHYLPMDLYPNSTKIAANLLKKGKTKEALQELRLGLSTIVSDEVVVPIPLLAAQDLVSTASNIDKSKKKMAMKLLDEAKMELQKAVLLGYTANDAKEYKSLKDEINNLEKEINGKNRVEGLYSKLKKHFKKFVNKVRNERKVFDPNSVWNGTKVEHKDATKEENQDVLNFVNKGRLDAY